MEAAEGTSKADERTGAGSSLAMMWLGGGDATDDDVVVTGAVDGLGATFQPAQRIVEHARTLPGIEAVSLTSGSDMVRAHRLYESMGFVRVPERDWEVPNEDILLWVFRLPL